MKNSIINSNGIVIGVGKTYYYYNVGMNQIMAHTVIRLDCVYATASDGRVELDSLYDNVNDVKNNRLNSTK